MNCPILSLQVLIPLLAGMSLMAFPRNKDKEIKTFAILASFIVFLLSLVMFAQFDRSASGMQFVEGPYPWIPDIGISYHLGVDGLSMPLVFLTALLTFLSLIYSLIITERSKEYFILFLLLETGMMGTFVALDYVLFYVFWEISLVPMYFLIGIWGGPRREYAAIKFFLYTLVGSMAMLVAILAIYFNTGAKTFSILEIARLRPFHGQENMFWQSLCFFGFFLAFAIKVPAWPFHTWLPDAHVEAPTAGSVILAGVLLKMGGYGLVRVNLPTFPEAAHHFAWFIAAIGLIGIIYGALVAMAQTDFKKMIAYSSVNHMGYFMLGLAAACAVSPENFVGANIALNGAILQMFNHGIITGALFLCVGVIYERTHNRDLGKYGGLWAKVPVYGSTLVFFSMASLGLPGLAGFISEFFVFLGSFNVFLWLAAAGVIGVVVTAAFFLWMIQRVLLGPPNDLYPHLTDMDGREIFTLVPLIFFTLLIGLFPAPLLHIIDTASKTVLEALK